MEPFPKGKKGRVGALQTKEKEQFTALLKEILMERLLEGHEAPVTLCPNDWKRIRQRIGDRRDKVVMSTGSSRRPRRRF